MALKLLHVSDLHFGEPFGTRGEPLLDATVRDWWVSFPAFDGFLGHTYAALADLEELHAVLDRPAVVSTGDLTRVGSAGEARQADDYFSGSSFAGSNIGLRLGPRWVERAIPGNHDHWPGVQPNHPRDMFCMRGAPAQGGPLSLLQQSGGYPRTATFPLDDGSDLVLCALNTDEDVGHSSLSRVFARGHFVRQCHRAALLLGQRPQSERREVRGLLIHHSPLVRGYPLAIGPASMLALGALLDDANVQFVLTGHAHRWQVERHNASIWPRDILELRCGSTTSRDVFPDNRLWRGVSTVTRRRLHRNVAMCHEFEAYAGGVWLETTVYRRERRSYTQSGPFAPVAQERHHLSFA
ncbi:MAG TPA: metallophosphoesterase [Polyangiaceae bacterium]|nr:metallophosphoesterase [Polyangiaceae bacterium]